MDNDLINDLPIYMQRWINACANSLREWAGVVPPNMQVFGGWLLLATFKNPLLSEEYLDFKEAGDIPVTGNESLDTLPRDWLMDEVGRSFADMTWPLNMNSDADCLLFRDRLKAGLELAGWRLMSAEEIKNEARS
jgi:hypothetical protein